MLALVLFFMTVLAPEAYYELQLVAKELGKTGAVGNPNPLLLIMRD